MNRAIACFVVGLSVVACASPRGVITPLSEETPIRVYVYYDGNTAPEPVAGATVIVLSVDGRVAMTATTNREGIATIPASYDQSTTKYFLADFKPLLVSGARWAAGRREYNLPLHAEPLVNRATIKAP